MHSTQCSTQHTGNHELKQSCSWNLIVKIKGIKNDSKNPTKVDDQYMNEKEAFRLFIYLEPAEEFKGPARLVGSAVHPQCAPFFMGRV